MTTTATTAQARTYIATQHDRLNLSLYLVEDNGDGTETTTWIPRDQFPEGSPLHTLVLTASGTTHATGSNMGTATDERPCRDAACTPDSCPITVVTTVTYYRNAFVGPRISLGTHQKRTNLEPAQLALRAELSTQSARLGRNVPEVGDRYIVGELSGYQLIQNRSFDHRNCHCGNGIITYSAGTVTGRTFWADNSIDVTVTLEDGRTVTDQIAAPSGDVCF